jgi:4,5-dihydroxyphthalate decarboxylase
MALPLTMAISEYAHTRDLLTGRVRPEGIDLNILTYDFEHVGLRFAMSREFDVSEHSLGGFCAQVAAVEAPDIVGIPVFPSRVFRQGSFFINANAGIRQVGDLAGKRVGIPQWSQTATIYARGYLEHQAGVPLTSIDWFQGGVNSAGRKEGAKLNLPEGIRLTRVADRSLGDMLAAGDIDAMISARAPACFLNGHPAVRRLFDDPRSAEKAYFAETGIFPIMHIMVARRDVYEANRWIIRNLTDAFEEAKRRTLRAIADGTTSYLPVPWGPEYMADTHTMMFPDGDPWPYGINGNRRSLEAFLLYCFEQGVTARHLTPEDLFPPECSYEVIV